MTYAVICFCPGGFPGILWDEDATVADIDEAKNVGYVPIEMVAETFENEHSILKCFPTGVLSPQPFEPGFRQKLVKVAEACRYEYRCWMMLYVLSL
jgi:hypothetical protein